jgi:hypothetical protein
MDVSFESDCGKTNFNALGVASVETMRKNNIKKNIISFIDDVATSIDLLLLRFNSIIFV